MNAADLASFFAPGGALSRLLGDYRTRPEQQEMAAVVAEALARGVHGLVEAGTGVGKSLAYLVPGIAWALEQETRLVVSTHTKALQSQLIEHELPWLDQAGVFDRPFRYEICLGMENYVCLTRLLAEGQAEMLPGLDPDYAGGLRDLMIWCRGAVSGIRQDLPFAAPDALWRQVCVVSDLCLGRNCPQRAECFLQQARERQREADVLVTNHSFLFSSLAAENRSLPEFGAAVLDEAHRVEDVATSLLGDEVGRRELQALLGEFGRRGRSLLMRSLRRGLPSKAEELAQLAQNAAADLEPWWTSLQDCFAPGSDTLRAPAGGLPGLERPATDALRALATAVAGLRDVVATEQEAKDAAFLGLQVEDLARRLEDWSRGAGDGTVYWAENSPSARGARLRVISTPLDVSGRLRERVFTAIPSVILTSATLAVDRRFDYVRARLGIDSALELVLDSPFPYAEQVALYLPRAVPDPRTGEAYERAVIETVLHLLRVFGGGMFVLFTSLRFLRACAERLRLLAPAARILAQGDEPPHRLIREFKSHGDAVLLGVETFWQGVNVPGDALRCVVITKLPFDVPTHPVHQARTEALTDAGEDPFSAYSVPRAILMLRQGFGRLIRRHEDRGLVALLDARVRTRDWGRRFLRALPACPVLTRPDEAEAFAARHFGG